MLKNIIEQEIEKLDDKLETSYPMEDTAALLRDFARTVVEAALNDLFSLPPTETDGGSDLEMGSLRRSEQFQAKREEIIESISL